MSKHLIINADGYGLTAGINRAVEECIQLGTVSSISANVNGRYAEDLSPLAAKYPRLSVGCHLNPVVGRPVLSPDMVKSLVDKEGCFWGKKFDVKLLTGHIRLPELKQELLAQVNLCRDLAGSLTHLDAHMAKHRLPRYYPVFLDIAKAHGIGRIRTHRYKTVCFDGRTRISPLRFFFRKPVGLIKGLWNSWLRLRAKRSGLAMPDRGLFPVDSTGSVSRSIDAWLSLLTHVPNGFNEFWVHPAYVDKDLPAISGYVKGREEERQILTDERFRNNLYRSEVILASYHDIPMNGALSKTEHEYQTMRRQSGA